MATQNTVAPNQALEWNQQKRWLSITGVFAVAFLFRYFLVTRMPRPLSTDLYWNDSTGWNLAQGHGFTASLSGYVPAIFRTPGYPAFLAIIYKIFGHSIHAALVGNAVLDSLTAVLIVLMGWRLLGPVSGCVAGFLYALYPYPAIFCANLHQDMLLTLVVVLTLYLTLRAQQQPNRFGWWLLIGFMIGAIAMVKPFMAPYGVVPALAALASPALHTVKKFKAVALMVFVSILVISPWIARNYYFFHSFPPLALGGSADGMRVLLDEIKGGEDAGLRAAPNDVQTREQALSVVLEGQALVDSERADKALYAPQLRRLWPSVLRVAVGHIPRLWITRRAVGYNPLVSLIATILGYAVLFFGVIGMYIVRHRWRSWLAIYASVVFVTLLYAPIPIEARYTLPAKPAMILFVTAAVMFFYQRVRSAKSGTREAL